MEERIAIGLDLGGTYIKAGLTTESGISLGAWKEPTHASEGPLAVMEALLSITRKILNSKALSEWQSTHRKGPVGIGIGSPGVIDFKTGIVRKATGNLPGWTGMEIAPIFEKEFRMKTYVDNDANAYVLGEYFFGAGRGRKPKLLLGLTLGTGVGGGVVMEGQILHGAHGCAGELGHIIISDQEDAPPCSTGTRGTLESFASGPPISSYAMQQKDRYPDSLIFKNQGKRVDTEMIHQAALQGDSLALSTIHRTAYYLGLGLASLVNCYDPDLIVVGGGVANFGDLLLDPVRRIVQERVYFFSITRLEILPALLGGDGGYKGAAALALFPSKK